MPTVARDSRSRAHFPEACSCKASRQGFPAAAEIAELPKVDGPRSARLDACAVCGVTCAEHSGVLCGICRHPIEHHCAVCAALELEALADREPPKPLVTRKVRRRYGNRPTTFVAVDQGTTVGALLEGLGGNVERVFLVGPSLAQAVVGWREWALGELPRGWAHDERGHYFDGEHPTLRYRREPLGRPLEVLRAAQWFGEGDYDAERAGRAWAWLEAQVAAAFDEGRLLSTPATTARYLFVRSLGRREFPVLSDELQELIRSTSGQGRIELLDGPAEIPGLVELDARLAYAACVRELGHGIPTRDTRDEFAGHTRGRYRCTWTVPADWGHVGLLPSMTDAGGWEWIAEPGRSASGWVDGVELHQALAAGWDVTIHERLLFPEHRGRPLDAWAAKLLDILERPAAGDMIRHAVRALILHGIGAMHGRPHQVSRAGDDPAAIPEHAEAIRFDRDSGVWLWSEGTAQAWPELAHPEWSAAVWARARARLIDAPGPRGRQGAWHLERAQLVAFRTDAIYATVRPDWPDDGKVGRFRVKRAVEGPLPRPRTHAELLELRNGIRGYQTR